MDARTAVLQYVCPSVGVVLAISMYASPIRAVLRVNNMKSLGDLNPIPYTAMTANALGWLVYSTVIHDFFVYGSNVSGLLLGLFYVFTCYKFADEKAQDMMRNIMLSICALVLLMAVLHMAVGFSQQQKKTLWGSTAVAIQAVYYSSPLTTLATVLRRRDSSSFHRPLLITNMTCGVLWFCYGIAIADWFLAAPNGTGAAISLLSLVVTYIIPQKSSTTSSRGAQGANGRELLPAVDTSSQGKAVAAVPSGSAHGALSFQP